MLWEIYRLSIIKKKKEMNEKKKIIVYVILFEILSICFLCFDYWIVSYNFKIVCDCFFWKKWLERVWGFDYVINIKGLCIWRVIIWLK